MHTELEYFITSGGIAIGPSSPTWEAARGKLAELVNEGAAGLAIEKHPVPQPDELAFAPEPQEMTTAWATRMERSA